MSSQLLQVQFIKLLLTDKEEGDQHQDEVTIWKQKLTCVTDKEAWTTMSYQDQRSQDRVASVKLNIMLGKPQLFKQV